MSEYNSAHTGPEIDAAVSAVKTKQSTWDNKQDKITGKAGQVVGFDASGNPIAQEAPSGGGASSWNDLKDKPVIYEGTPDTLTWDGNTDGLLVSGEACRISSAAPTLRDLSGGCEIVTNTGDSVSVSADDLVDLDGMLVLIGLTGLTSCPEDVSDPETGDVLMPKGLYFQPQGDVYPASLTIPGYTGFGQEKIAPSHLYQPNWNQTDESAPDYVKNRTHHDAWSANKFAQEIAFTTNDGATFGNFNQSLGLEAGKTYTILCDGDEYTGVAEAVDVFGTTAVRVGDFDAIGWTSETMSAPICVYDTRDGRGVVFLKETFTEETSKFVVVLEGKNKEEYWSVALDPAESPVYNNMFVASWKPVPYSDFAHGFSAVLSIDGVEYSVNDADPKVFVISTPGGYWTLNYDGIMVALCSESAILFINDTQAGLNNTPQVDMKKLTFNVPVFAPSMELKKLDSKYLPTPSWNDLADKPFGETGTVILEEQTLVFNEESGAFVAELSATLKVGDTISVSYNGTVYECVGANAPNPEMPYVVFGNMAIMGGESDTGEPFCLLSVGTTAMIVNADMEAPVVKISFLCIEKLPLRFYDRQAVFYVSGSDPYLYTDVKLTTKATKADVVAAAKNMPIVISNGDVHFAPAAFVYAEGDYAQVYAGMPSTDKQLYFRLYCTAELTGS